MEGYQERAEVRLRMGDKAGAEADRVRLLNDALDRTFGKRKKTKESDKKQPEEGTRRKSDKNIENYRKMVVADSQEQAPQYSSYIRGKVQNRNVEVKPEPMFALNYYERLTDVRRGVRFYRGIDELNSRGGLPHRLLITNQEMPLTEKRANEHFAWIEKHTREGVQSSEEVMARLARAIDFYVVQDFNSALEDLTAVVSADAKCFPAYFMRALIRHKQLEYEEANSGEAENGKRLQARAEMKKNEYELVRRDLDKTIELAPDFAYAYYNRAFILVEKRDYRAALADYDKAIELDGALADAYYNRGLLHLLMGNPQLARKDLSKAGELGIAKAYGVMKRFVTEKTEE